MGIETLEQFLNFVPGVYANRNDVFGEPPVFRGHLTGESSNGVLLLVNDVRSDSMSGGAFNSLAYFSLNNVERVEIIRAQAPRSKVRMRSMVSSISSREVRPTKSC